METEGTQDPHQGSVLRNPVNLLKRPRSSSSILVEGSIPETNTADATSLDLDLDATTHLTPSQIAAVEIFTGDDGNRDARRWFFTLELVLGGVRRDEVFRKLMVTLFDIKLDGEAARWADQDPEILGILQSETVQESDLSDLKRLFLSRYHRDESSGNGVRSASEELFALKQSDGESLECFYKRARRILTRVCEDSYFEGQPRLMTKAEEAWVNMVMLAFTGGIENPWVGFHVEESAPKSLEQAYTLAKKKAIGHKRFVDRRQRFFHSGSRSGAENTCIQFGWQPAAEKIMPEPLEQMLKAFHPHVEY